MLCEDWTPLLYACPNISFHDASGKEWMRFEGGNRIVREGYVWNGSSPKRYCRFLRRWIGTPDTPRNLRASRDHDADYQFSATARYPFDRLQSDIMFRETLREDRFRFANAFFGAVRDFGGKAWSRPIEGQYSKLL
jgi:hypothetical protein